MPDGILGKIRITVRAQGFHDAVVAKGNCPGGHVEDVSYFVHPFSFGQK